MWFKKKRPSILFADDERILVEFLALLYSRSFQVFCAWTIDAAIKVLKDKKANAALIEPWFRTERSMQFVQELTAMSATFGLPPVVVLSRMPKEEIKVAEPVLKPIAILEKPADPDEIDNALAIALSRSRNGNGY